MKKLYLLFFLLLGFQLTFGQQKTAIVNVNFQSAGIDSVANELQRQTGYRFYYDADCQLNNDCCC